ncbi:MAG: hypothetical protein PHP40_02465 [Eubacteriales bacterium]|nr:hypothetical protein [Eubacteriales bacterium]
MKTSRILWSLLLLGCGVLLLLHALNIGQTYDLTRIIASVLLLGISISSFLHRQYFIGTLPLAVILYLWRVPLGLEDMNIFLVIVAIAILGIGLSALLRPRSRHRHVKIHHDFRSNGEIIDAGQDDAAADDAVSGEDEQVNINCSFGEETKYIHARQLKRVNVGCSFGGTKIFFDQCQVAADPLQINLSVAFSGVELVVPRNWAIQDKVSSFASSVSEEGLISRDDEIVNVRLQGSLSFSGVKIRYV